MRISRFLWRQYRADRGAAWTATIVVFMLALVAALAPRALDRMYTEDLHQSVDDTAVSLRDISSVSPLPPSFSNGDDPWAGFSDEVGDIRAQASPLVQEALGEPRFSTATPDFALERGESDGQVVSFLAADPFLEDNVDIVEGSAPAEADSDANVIEVTVSRASAEALKWEVGQERLMEDLVSGMSLRLSGIYEVHDDGQGDWQHRRASVTPDVSDDFDLGVTYTAAAYVDPDSASEVLELFVGAATTRVWLPVDVTGLTASDAAELRSGVAEFGSRVYQLSPSEAGAAPAPETAFRSMTELSFTTETVDVLETVQDRRTGSTAVLAIVAAGPIGVALAVLTLAARLMIERRRSSLSLVSARGASPRQFRWWLGAEGLLIGLPAAAAGWLVAALALPGAVSTIGVALPLAVGLAPGVLLPIAGRPSGLRTVRRDIGLQRPSAARRFVEVLVVVAAIGSCVSLNMRGLDSGDGGVDPLLAATPLLVAFAVTMLVMRLYPAPVAAISRRLRQGRGTVAYLGTARATRDPAGGLVPMLALVVGLSIAAFSVVMWSTTEEGLEDTAWHEIGADAQMIGSAPTDEQVTAAGDVEGVDTIIPLSTPGPTLFQVGPESTRFPLTVTDVADVAELQERRGDSAVPIGIVGLTPDGAVPIASSSDGPEIGTVGELALGSQRIDAVVTEHVDEVAGLNPSSTSWFLADRETVTEAGVSDPAFRNVLVGATPDAQPDYDAVLAALGGTGTITTPGEVAESLRGPVNGGTAIAIVAAIAITGLLCAASVVLTLVVSAPSRGRLLAQLRTLGLSGRQGEGLVAWETAPVAIASLGAGLLLGVTLPGLILGGIDLTTLTGGQAQPTIVLPVGLLLMLLAAFVTVVAMAVGGSMLAVRRFRPASVLRVGDE